MIFWKKNKQPSSKKVALLKVSKDNLLKENILVICCLANQKLYAFVRIKKYLTMEKAKLLCSKFSQFNYTTMVRMLCRKIYSDWKHTSQST